MNRRVSLIGLLVLYATMLYGQETVTLDQCQKLARDNYALTRQKLLLSEIETLQKDNVSGAYLPQLYIEGQSTWQNEVTGLDLSIPGMSVDKLDKLQYKSQVVFNQIIYNGGKKNLQKKLILKGVDIERRQLDVELYALNFIINRAYFSALMIQEGIESYMAMLEALNANYNQVKSAVEHGVATKDRAAALEAEIIAVEQMLMKLHSQKQSSINTLELYTTLEIETSDELELPLLSINNDQIDRREYDLFDAQQSVLFLSNEMEKASRRPQFSGFGQVGYGLPGFNMLKNEPSEFYMIGAKLSWKITDWKTAGRNIKLNTIKSKNISYQKEVFNKKLSDLIQQQESNLDYLKKVMKSDEKLVSARKEIVEVSASKLANGVIRSADYINDLQQSIAAEIKQKQHHIEYAMTVVALHTLKGSGF